MQLFRPYKHVIKLQANEEGGTEGRRRESAKEQKRERNGGRGREQEKIKILVQNIKTLGKKETKIYHIL